MKRAVADHVGWAAREPAAEDFRVKKLVYLGGSKATGHVIYGSLGVRALHIPTPFSKGRTL